MLARIRKIAGGDLAGRFGAWWDGRDYAPPAPVEGEAEAAAADPDREPKKTGKDAKPAKPAKAERAQAEDPPAEEVKASAKPAKVAEPTDEAPATEDVATAVSVETSAARIKALETLWGEGRLAPGSAAIDALVLDAALEHADRLGGMGFIGSDAALLTAFAGRSDRDAHVAEWRGGCASRLKELAPKAMVEECDVDRPRGFPEHLLEGMVSCEAFAFADHKSGLASRVHRALTETGRWVFLDTTRTTAKTPPEAFASAWAEPLLSTAEEIEHMLKHAGFGVVKRTPVTALVLEAAREGYVRLAQVLEAAAAGDAPGKEGALFLQELAWEAQSWRARMRALEGGALEVNLWVADKGAPPLVLTQPAGSVPEEVLDLAVEPDDAGAAETLFEAETA